MDDLIKWLQIESSNLPIPIIAAIVHYQFVTIHPYYDSNGRTARLLTTLALYKNDYGFEGSVFPGRVLCMGFAGLL